MQVAWEIIKSAPKDGAGRGPEGERGPFVLLTDGKAVFVAFWNGEYWFDGYFRRIRGLTHWAPLPDLPKRGGKPRG